MEGSCSLLIELAVTRRTQVGPREWRIDPSQVLTSSLFFPEANRGGYCRLRLLGPEPDKPLLVTASFVEQSLWGSEHIRLLGVSGCPAPGNPPTRVVAQAALERFHFTVRPLSSDQLSLAKQDFNKLFFLITFASTPEAV